MTNIKTATAIAQTLIKFDTTTPDGIDSALEWLKNWAIEQQLFLRSIPTSKALLIQTNPHVSKHFNFVTHIDVVPAPDWSEAFSPKVTRTHLIGRGAVDDKGPLAIALQVLMENRARKDINLSCLIISDEETDNTEISQVLKSEEFKPEFSLVIDGGTHQQLDIGQKGIVRCDLHISTSGGHSAFEKIEQSASLQLLKIINELNAFSSKLEHDPQFTSTFINISTIKSETVPYGMPESAVAHLEIQFPAPVTSSVWIGKLKQINKVHNNINIEIHWVSEPHLLKEEKLIELFETLGLECITTGGNNLAKDLCLAGIKAASHCPIDEYMAHCKNEQISLKDIEKGISLYNNIINAFAQR